MRKPTDATVGKVIDLMAALKESLREHTERNYHGDVEISARPCATCGKPFIGGEHRRVCRKCNTQTKEGQ